MLALLLSTAMAQQTRVFESDEDVIRWMVVTRTSMRSTLPVAGPTPIANLASQVGKADIRFFTHGPDEDTDTVAMNARAEIGAPCAIGLAPLDTGWAAWTSGNCTVRFMGAWRFDGGKVVDDRGRTITVPQFAIASGDREVFKQYRQLDRRRGRSLVELIVGSGLLYVGQIGSTAARNDRMSVTPWTVTTLVGAGITGLGVVELSLVQANDKSHPRNVRAHYDDEAILERVRAHNRRLRITPWGATGIRGTF